MATCQDAANFAEEAAKQAGKQGPNDFTTLSAEMCWDAVMKCAQLAGVIDQARFDSCKGKYYKLVGIYDTPVTSAGSMANLAAGHALGFFFWENNKWVCAHAMLSLGNGRAAGNKNDCIGHGKSVSWEVLDLQNLLPWVPNPVGLGPDNIPGGYFHQTVGKNRNVYVRSRPITRLGEVR